ncbi:MAG: tripartite tricarboxylate transporter substrate binding protein [Actinophytocola sp.]|uniref:Bug family tripartite tricarboxylate transporter substrate binding protein n=1 Tax=Actinophytocola sp. TaxID=1872138 RepID=UPI0013239F92|nr:tripartite tricarboxylate transporter substrate-binding protein [Actinophytocola sp.]MPZ79711.1 tripartite tricarboxylate transporter substrate binding protein [Actinophytocola sp.]
MRTKRFTAVVVSGLLIMAAACTRNDPANQDDAAASDYPSRPLDMTVAFGAGGGVDIMSRTISKLLTENDLYPGDISVTNREGGSGSKGYGYVFNRKGSAYDMTATSGSFISTPIQASTPWSATGFTPIALLGTDEDVVWVNADSPWKSLDDLVKASKSTPLTVGGAGLTTIDFIAFKQFADVAGVKFKYVAHDSGPEAANSLLSGSINVLSHSASSLYGLYKSGDIRPLAIGGVDRLDQLPDTPTFHELGYEITVSQPRGLVMPPDVPDEVVQWWQDAVTKLVELPEWKDYLKQNFVSERVLVGKDFADYLKETVAGYTQALNA